MAATPKEVRRARAFLESRGLRKVVSPRKFANAAKENNVGFRELLAMLGRLYTGGQHQAFFIREQIEKAVASRA